MNAIRDGSTVLYELAGGAEPRGAEGPASR